MNMHRFRSQLPPARLNSKTSISHGQAPNISRSLLPEDTQLDWKQLRSISLPNTWQQLLKSCLVIIFCVICNWYFSHDVTQQHYKPVSFNAHSSAPTSSLSAQQHIPSSQPMFIKTLDAALLPTLRTSSGEYEPERRLIFIGDIHGCMEELMSLLEAVEFDENRDHIVATGDFTNKGPATHNVIDFLIEKGASCVRGNHDQHILNLRGDIGSDMSIATGRSSDAELQLAQSLTAKQTSYLASCPFILRIGDVGTADYVVVHGGLVPSLTLEQQDPWTVMHMRIINPVTLEPFEKHEKSGCVHWADLWNEYQTRPANLPGVLNPHYRPAGSKVTTVIYGHDAKRGLKIKPHSKGLDTSCVKGKFLTALSLNGAGEQKLYQVPCNRQRG